jgi:sirohydrochlorin ferrochelatase
MSTQDYSIVLAGHGSRDPAGIAEFMALVDSCASVHRSAASTTAFWNSPRPPSTRRWPKPLPMVPTRW